MIDASKDADHLAMLMKMLSAQNLIRARVATQGQPATTTIGVEPTFDGGAFGIFAHKGAIQVAGVGVGDGVRYFGNLAVDKFLDGPRAAVRTWNVDVHDLLLSIGSFG